MTQGHVTQSWSEGWTHSMITGSADSSIIITDILTGVDRPSNSRSYPSLVFWSAPPPTLPAFLLGGGGGGAEGGGQGAERDIDILLSGGEGPSFQGFEKGQLLFKVTTR